MIRLEPLDAPLGALIQGTHLDDLASNAHELAAAVRTHGVIVLRDWATPSGALTTTDLLQIGEALGDLEAEIEADHQVDHPAIRMLTNTGPDGQVNDFDERQAATLHSDQQWRSDGSFLETPPVYTLLYAVEVPRRGGQTQHADMRKALQLLPPDDRAEIEELTLVHSFEHSRARPPSASHTPAGGSHAAYPPVDHPWLRTHPDNEPSLYMGAHAYRIAGREPGESQQWFAEIEAQLSVHDVVYEHQWRAHDLLVWDNRITLHRLLPYDIANEPRVMRRLAVAG